MHFQNLDFRIKMNQSNPQTQELKRLISNLQKQLDELKAFVYSDTSSYQLDVDYDEVLEYYQTNDDDDQGI